MSGTITFLTRYSVKVPRNQDLTLTYAAFFRLFTFCIWQQSLALGDFSLKFYDNQSGAA